MQAPWADANLPGLARRLLAEVALAAVRSASPGMPVSVTATHPFVVDGLAGTHNGRIEGFRAHVAAPLLERLGPAWAGRLEIVTDASVLVMLAAAEVARGATPADAARAAVSTAAAATAAAGQWATLTLVLASAEGIVAVNAAHGRPANSLYVADRGPASWLASEPLDDGGDWMPVPGGATAVLAADAPVAVAAAATDPDEASSR